MKVNIVVMGQSGNGKSTLINAIMGKEVAETGKGAAITTKNQLYATPYTLEGKEHLLILYDTVGIELSNAITQQTLDDIENHLRTAQKLSTETDINIVWFCINNKSSRFQDFEIELIRKLSYEYEIPFIIVLTQCFDNQIGELDAYIQTELPEIVTTRILAKDYKLRNGVTIPAFGVEDLLDLSILGYDRLKVSVLESKLIAIKQTLSISESTIAEYKKNASLCVDKYANMAYDSLRIPTFPIFKVRKACKLMIQELNKIYGIPPELNISQSILDRLFKILIISVYSASTGKKYTSKVGNKYSDTLLSVISQSKHGELENQELMKSRIEQQLEKINKGR